MERSLRITNPETTEEYVLMNSQEPAFTKSWHPLGHNRCIYVMEDATKELGIKIQRRFYSLSKDHLKMLGAWVIGEGDTKKVGNDTLFQCILFRNSINKSYSFGLNGGTDAYICENLMVFGSFIDFRRHTMGLDDKELYRVVIKGITNLKPRLDRALAWHQSLRNIKLFSWEIKSLAYDAIREKIISQKSIPNFHKLLFGEGNEKHYEPDSLFSFHGACTEEMRNMRMTEGFQKKQERLNSFIVDRYSDRLPMV